MNQELWDKILAYNFDDPPAEYGFSIRLANENYWTKSFTKKAILEYKKFMYLAATSEFMVSPSEIVDTVWHQHLIFTQSYQDFCNILGKYVQHLPSTHNKEDFEKFKQAKERTIKFYERDFGPQPKDIWFYNTMFESLNLNKSKLKIRTFLIIGILAAICLTIPAYHILNPLYRQIHNPNFIFGFIGLSIIIFLVLEYFNRTQLKAIASKFDKTSFVYDLNPFELVYCKTQKLAHIINGAANELIDKGTIYVNPDNSIEFVNNDETLNIEQLHITTALQESGKTFYPNLLRNLITKPVFWNVANSMDAFRKYFNKSKKFGWLFYTNFAVLTVLLLLCFTRMVTGFLRDKPVTQIFITTLLLILIIIIFLNRLTKQIATTTIPNLYKEEILPTQQVEYNWQWSYFLMGASVLSASFIPLVNYVDKHNINSGGCGTSCGSSCGSSCSSCGGCGGD
jgi:hypothetical protein